MKTWVRIFLFLMAFQMEVRVKASGLIQAPQNCLTESANCAVKAVDQAFHLKNAKLALHATPGSVLEKQNSENWRFIKGDLWVEKSKNLHFETVYGDVSAQRGEYWIISGEDKIWIRNMSADLTVTLRDGKVLQPPPGFQFWISGLNSDAQSDYGMIEPIDMQKHIPVWLSLFQGSKPEFIERVSHFRENWGDLVEKSSVLYKDQALRKLASVDGEKKAIQAKKRRAELEKQRIRELFRSRVFDR